MTVLEFSDLVKCPLEVRSGYNGKILCRQYSGKKHEKLQDREVNAVWSEIRAKNGGGYSSFARPVICVSVHGREEYEQAHQREAHP